MLSSVSGSKIMAKNISVPKLVLMAITSEPETLKTTLEKLFV